MYYVSENYFLNSSTYTDGSWLPDIQPGDLSLGMFSTAVTTRSLSIVGSPLGSGLNWDMVSLNNLDRSLLYYEDPTGKISVLSHQAVGNEKNRTLKASPTAEWVNLTSQESKSLPDEFRNTPASIDSKTLYESLVPNTTLRAPFTCGANWSVIGGDVLSVGALFYSPQLNASNPQFAIECYFMGAGDSAGNFTTMIRDCTKSPILHSRLQVNIYHSWSTHIDPKTGPGLQPDYPVRYSSV